MDALTATVTSPLEMSETTTSSGTTEARRSPELGVRHHYLISPPDGRIPALTSEAQKKKAAEAEARRGVDLDEPTPGGWLDDLGPGGLRVRCILGFNGGPPMTPSAYNNNVQLFQTPDYVVILNEMIHDARIVPLDGRPHGTLRQWAGDLRGRWEGDTLIVDTVNFHAAPLMTTSEFSANKHYLIERFRRIDADTLLDQFTVEDPTTWTRPWTGQVPMKRSDDSIYECRLSRGQLQRAQHPRRCTCQGSRCRIEQEGPEVNPHPARSPCAGLQNMMTPRDRPRHLQGDDGRPRGRTRS